MKHTSYQVQPPVQYRSSHYRFRPVIEDKDKDVQDRLICRFVTVSEQKRRFKIKFLKQI